MGLPTESWAQNDRNISSKNMEDKNALILVVWRDKADYQIFIYKMPQMEKSKKETSQKTRKREN